MINLTLLNLGRTDIPACPVGLHWCLSLVYFCWTRMFDPTFKAVKLLYKNINIFDQH